jgi:hypothetical protein
MAIIGTDTSPEPWQIVFHVLVGLSTVGAVVADASVRPAVRSVGCGITLRGSQAKLRLPPQAARTEGPPRTRTGQ